MKKCFTNKWLILLPLIILSPAWGDTTPQPTKIVIPKDLETPPPGAWTSDTFKGVPQEIQKTSGELEGHNSTAGAHGILAASPVINITGITILAFFKDLTASDDEGICKIAAAAKAYPNLVAASYYVVVSPIQGQAPNRSPVTRDKKTCLSDVRPRLDLGGGLFSSLQPEGLPAALVMYRGTRRWIRIKDSGIALNELFLAAGVPSPFGPPSTTPAQQPPP